MRLGMVFPDTHVAGCSRREFAPMSLRMTTSYLPRSPRVNGKCSGTRGPGMCSS